MSKQRPTSGDKRKKTSIMVDQELWREFGAELRRKGIEYSDGLEVIMHDFLQKKLHIPAKKAKPISGDSITRAQLHELLDEIIDDGSLHMDAIVSNLRLLAFSLRIAGKYSNDEIERIRQNLPTK